MDIPDTGVVADEVQGRQDDAETFEVQQLETMEQPKWNEARLDDLKSTVDRGFERMDAEFRDVRGEMKAGFDGIHRLMHRYSLVFIGALVALVLARGAGLG